MMTNPNDKFIALKHINLDPRLQMRGSLDLEHVKTLAEVLAEGEKAELSGDLPVIYYDGQINWLCDGFHRHEAHGQAGRKKMKCEVRPGTYRDALRHALAANAQHGLRRPKQPCKMPNGPSGPTGRLPTCVGCNITLFRK